LSTFLFFDEYVVQILKINFNNRFKRERDNKVNYKTCNLNQHRICDKRIREINEKKINVVKKEIKISRFIFSNIKFTIDSSKNARTKKSVTKNAKTIITKEIDTTITKDVETNVTKNAKIMNDIKSITKWEEFDFISTFSESWRDEREFTNVLFLIIFLKFSNSSLIISFLKEAEDFVFREKREIIMLTMKQINENQKR
jgi:hypothetical protein